MGQFREGKLNGMGTLLTIGGEIIAGEWDRNRLVNAF